MSEAPAGAPSEPLVWLSWPTIYIRSPERSVVIIDLAPIDEDEVTRRALPDALTTCGSFGQARCPRRRHEQIGHFLTGRVRVQRHRRLRRVEAALHLANDPIAIIREEV
jgi:RNase P/RNase MRP subunit POP5